MYKYRKVNDARWQFGILPKGNSDFVCGHHFISPPSPGEEGYLAPQVMARFILADCPRSSNKSSELGFQFAFRTKSSSL